MEKAIELSIKGGWGRATVYRPELFSYLDTVSFYGQNWPGYFLDPVWWQCLGKSLGWPANMCTTCGEPNKENCCECCNWISGWQFFWHRFIDHLADGKSPNDFFTQLTQEK